MYAADRTCELECVKDTGAKSGARREFVGPVKIVLVDPTPADYKRKKWGSAVYTLAMMLMGLTVFTVFFFTLTFRLPFLMNVHVFLCTMGTHLFLSTGILMFNSLFGGSTQLKPADRKFQHFFLEVAGGVTGTLGGLFSLGSLQFTIHAISGFLAIALMALTSLIGPTVYFSNPDKLFGRFNKKAHIFFGLPTFCLSTTCFIMGLLKESFIKWSPILNLHYMLIVFTSFYSLSVLASIFIRSRIG